MDFSSGVTQVGSFISGLTKKPHFWEAALVGALILLLLSHKLVVEALVE